MMRVVVDANVFVSAALKATFQAGKLKFFQEIIII